MKTIHEYLKDYGKYTFLEKEFNEVDNVILSLLSYIDFSGIVPAIRQGSIKLKDASELFYRKHDRKEIDTYILAVRESSLLLGEMALTNRFKDLDLLNYEYQVTFDTQFGALCIKLPNKMMYVSYEGTDNYVSGWKEDFMMAYKFPTTAHSYAIEYLNLVVPLFGCKIIVGGHSKGGNLALVASMYCKNRVYRKIKHVYSNDGPGLRKNELNTNRYKRISYRFTHIIPREDFVGMLFFDDNNHVVINSNKRLFMQHNAVNWEVEEDHFVRCELSEFSKRVKKSISSWIDKNDDKKVEEFINILFSVLKKAEIDDLLVLKKSKVSNMLKILKEMKNINKEDRNILTSGLMQLYNEWKEQ